MFKILEPLMQESQEIQLFSHEEHFLYYGFSWKICKIKAYDAGHSLET